MFLSIFLDFRPAHRRVSLCERRSSPPYRIGADRQVRPFGTVTGPVLGILNVDRRREGGASWPRRGAPSHTDGITEAKSPMGEFFGDERLRDLLALHAGAPVAGLCARVADAIEEFQGGVRHDDATLLGVRRSG
jgi:two-component system response regulator